MISYKEYLKNTNQKDSRVALRRYLIDEKGMSEKEANREAFKIDIKPIKIKRNIA